MGTRSRVAADDAEPALTDLLPETDRLRFQRWAVPGALSTVVASVGLHLAGGLWASGGQAPAGKALGWGMLGWVLSIPIRVSGILLWRWWAARSRPAGSADNPEETAAAVRRESLVAMLLSGPAEEIPRVAFLVALNYTPVTAGADTALLNCVWSFSVGWTLVETVFFLAQGLQMLPVIKQARELESSGADATELVRQLVTMKGMFGRLPTSYHPMHSVFERCGAAILHTSLGFVAAAQPWLSVASTAFHSASSLSLIHAIWSPRPSRTLLLRLTLSCATAAGGALLCYFLLSNV